MKSLNGVHLKHCKNSQDENTVIFPLPKLAVIPMSQTMGAPCEPIVNVGDKVFCGQKIGETDAFMSVPVHSSVSGTVMAISDYLMANGRVCKSLTIEADGEQTLAPEIKPPVIDTREDFIKAVRESGACGLGGAGFPTHVKLRYDREKTPIDTLVINAAECEPYITSDYRELIEHPEDVLGGVKLLMEKLEIKYAKLCIENNKPKAIELLTKMAADDDNIEVVTLPSRYPQGAEKVIIYSATGRMVMDGELPSNQGVLVMNVSTTAFIYRYTKTGIPLISRRLTLDGSAVSRPCNVEVLIGTRISDLLDYAEAKDYKKLIAGGPMMGMCLYDTSAAVTKTYNALLCLAEEEKPKPVSACIRCGKCISVCPYELMPYVLEKAYDRRDIETLTKYNVMLCMNCGCCTYICPAGRPLAEKNQLAKMIMPRKK